MAKAITGVGTMGADTTADISVAGFLAGCFGTDRQSCPA